MKIQLIDRKIGMCNQWQAYFANCNDVTIHNGDFFDLATDCVVSPANSFCFMGWFIRFGYFFDFRLASSREITKTNSREI